MHNFTGIIVYNSLVLHTCLCVFSPQLATCIHWHIIGTKYKIKQFILQVSTEPICLLAVCCTSTAISPVSGISSSCHPLVRHLAIHQGISLGQKIVHVHYSQKHIME